MILNIGTSLKAEDNVVYLEKGSPSPFSGFLFQPTEQKRLRLLDEENNFNKQRVELLNNIIDNQKKDALVYEQRLTNFKEQNDKLSQANQSSDFLNKTIYFIAGSVITGLIGYGVYKTK